MLRSVWRYLSIFTVVLTVLFWVGCGDEPTQPRDQINVASLSLYTNVEGTSIAALVVEVTAADIPEPLIFNIPVEDGVASGAITVPAGSDRTITVRAYDSQRIETHRGQITTNLVAGENPPLTIVLYPLVGDVIIEVEIGTYIVTVAPSSAELLYRGETIQLTATVTDGAGNVLDVEVVWASTRPTMAKVDETGLVTAMSKGEAEIVANYSNMSGKAEVAVPLTAEEHAEALKAEGKSGVEVCQVMHDVYGVSALGAAHILHNVGYSADEAYQGLQAVYGITDVVEAERILFEGGFSPDEYLESTALSWVEAFSPVLRFDGSHHGLPMSAETYFTSGLLYPVVGAGTIWWTTDWNPACDPGKGIVSHCGRDECTCGMSNNSFQALSSGQVPTYYKVISDIEVGDEGRLRIAYWWFYGFQPYCNDFPAGEDGAHHGDWEHIVVTTTPDRTSVEYVTYFFHGDWYTRRDFPADGNRPMLYVGKLGHGSYHSRDHSGWMVGTAHHCCHYADYRNPNAGSIWYTTDMNLVSLRGDSESWLRADRVGSRYELNGNDYTVTSWRWGPHVSYCVWYLFGCMDWEHNYAPGTHPTVDRLDWTLRSCDGEGCGTSDCSGLVYPYSVNFNQGWPWDSQGVAGERVGGAEADACVDNT